MTDRPIPHTPAPPLAALAGLVLMVLIAHALLLTGLPIGAGEGRSLGLEPMQVRQIVRPPPVAPVLQEPAAAKAPAPRRTVRPQANAPSLPAAADPSPAAPPLPDEPRTADAAPAPDPTAAVADAQAAASAADAEAAASAADAQVAASAAGSEAAAPTAGAAVPVADAASATGGLEPALVAPGGGAATPPVYATRVPPPATLRYELRRGAFSGEGELAWRPGPEGYELQIEGRAFGLPLLGQRSTGGFDAAGLAPLRFLDRRRGRDVRAANFQRDKAVISWSGVTGEQPLLAGAQDRLSWMIQLAAIVDADPGRFNPGGRVVMQVAGARGDVDLWAFGVLARDAVDVVGARIDGALALRREPRKPFDTVVEVWLDPARQHLPVRLKLATAGGGDALEFLLKP